MEVLEADIIDEILNGNKEKYVLLMKKYNQRLYRICRSYLKDEAEIEDVMQDAYIKAYQNLSSFQGRAQFSTWLTRILINECLMRLKKMKRISLVNNDEKSEAMNFTDKKNPETESMNKELKNLLETAIDALPEKYRSIFVMREVEKMSIEETSKTLELTESNVKVRLNRAKEMLRNSLMNTYPVGALYEFNLIRCDRVIANVLAKI